MIWLRTKLSDTNGWKPIHLAAKDGYSGISQLSFQNGTSANDLTTTDFAYSHYDAGNAHLALQHGFDFEKASLRSVAL